MTHFSPTALFTPRGAFASLLFVGVFVSCKDATQVDVKLRTNVPFQSGTSVALWAHRGKNVGAPLAESAEPWLSDGEIGNIVVVPERGTSGEPLRLRLAMGLRGKPAAQCLDEGDAKDCIIARRNMGFIANTRLRVPVVMYLACEGVKCDVESTCSYLGRCVSASIDPARCAEGDGCSLPDEPPFDPRPGDAGAPDARSDVEASGSDGGSLNDGGFDAASDGGTPATSRRTLMAGNAYTCALLGNQVKCWGDNTAGTLGLGDTIARGANAGSMGPNLPFLDLGGGTATLASGATISGHACALLESGDLKCWGANGAGQLGLGDAVARGGSALEMGAALPAVALGIGRRALQVVNGANHTCALLDDQSGKCWGINDIAQLGTEDGFPRGNMPDQMGDALPTTKLGTGRKVEQLSAGGSFNCARLDNGAVKCWGVNSGILGIGSGDTQRGDLPGSMGDGLPAVDFGPAWTALEVAAGGAHACARLVSQAGSGVKCWGLNDEGQLGLGDRTLRGLAANQLGDNLPLVDLGPARVVQLALGNRSSCARFDNGTVKCWGQNEVGELGVGDGSSRGVAPGEMGAALPVVDLGPGRTAVEIAAGASHVCARLDNGGVKCWGRNNAGQLGLGDTVDRGVSPLQMGANLPTVPLQ